MLLLGNKGARGHVRIAALRGVGAGHRVQPRMEQEKKMVIQLEIPRHIAPSAVISHEKSLGSLCYLILQCAFDTVVMDSKY